MDPKDTYRTAPAVHGIVVFAHGARDAEWARPFAEIARRVREARPEARVTLAFLEIMAPTLEDAVRSLAGSGCTSITIVPAFLGMGGHLKRDLPAIVARLQTELPGTSIVAARAAGEDEAVIAAIAKYGAGFAAPSG